MDRYRPTVLLAALALALAPRPGLSATTPELLAPADGAVVRGADLRVVYTVPAGTRTVVLVDEIPWDGRRVPVPGDRLDLEHLSIRLTEGRHRIRVLAAETEAELLGFTVVYAPPYSTRTAAGPRDRPYAFHTRQGEAACSGCHNLPGEFDTVPDRPLSPAGKVCAACHPGIEAAPRLHGPVAVYACFQCHRTDYGPARFAVRSQDAAGCRTCHDDFLARALGREKYVHGPVATGACAVCHDPHGGQTTAILRQTPPDLCLLCHAQTLPLPAGRELHAKLACTGCHDPHGGATALLTRLEGNPLCRSCHPDVDRDAAGHPLAGHPVLADVDPSNPARPLTCVSCHDPHGTRDVTRLGIERNETLQRRFCRRCHY